MTETDAMPELNTRIFVPFTQDQIEQLNRFQTSGSMHPFTCPDHSDTSLVAQVDGWHCPHREGFTPIDVLCGYTQDWAHSFMADAAVLDSMSDARNLFSAFFDQRLHKRMGAAKMRIKNTPESSRYSEEIIGEVAQAIRNSNDQPWPEENIIPAGRYAEAALEAYHDYQIELACAVMHDAYEKAALGAGWVTNPESRKPWAGVPEANKQTMRAAVGALFDYLGVL